MPARPGSGYAGTSILSQGEPEVFPRCKPSARKACVAGDGERGAVAPTLFRRSFRWGQAGGVEGVPAQLMSGLPFFNMWAMRSWLRGSAHSFTNASRSSSRMYSSLTGFTVDAFRPPVNT